MVNRSARVSGMSQGGQILMSSAVFQHVEKIIPTLGNLIVKKLGEFQLKGKIKGKKIK
jgi:class 3 adenylate cyclase